MPATFVVSDTHFGHAGVCKFLRDDGTKLRPWTDPDEMDEDMVRMWNETVRPNDKVYHLGDVVINRKALKTLARLNGEKVLIKGNHDIFKLEDYTPYFKDIRSYHVMNGMIFSHIPIHDSGLYRFGTNIHGHTHSNRVKKTVSIEQTSKHDPRPFTVQEQVIDTRYHCVCVEQTDFRPILLERMFDRIKEEGGIIGFKS